MPRKMGKLTNKVVRYGWRRDCLDRRDRKWSAPRALLKNLPSSVDNRDLMPPVWNQQFTNTCTGQSMAAQIYGFQKNAQVAKPIVPSSLFIYWNTRDIEDTEAVDSGATLRNTIKAVARWGFASEECWPFDTKKVLTQPVKPCYVEAEPRKITAYARVDQRLDQLKAYLAARGTISFGFAVYANFESQNVAKTGILTMPDQNNDAPVGGHAVLLVGYDDAKKMFLVRNSWGSDWGIGGYFWMPYSYVLSPDLAADFWTVTILDTVAISQ